MPEHLRALIIILVLATAFFSVANRSACAISSSGNFTRRRNLWLSLTLAAFLVHNFWVYTLIAIPLLIRANHHETNKPALFFFILFVLPMTSFQIPGIGLVNYLFDLSHARLLTLLILLPAFFALLRQSDNLTFGRSGPDKALAAYLLLLTVLFIVRETSLTNSFRKIFYLFTDIFLPYFVISRSLKNMQAYRDALLSLVLAIMVLAPLAVFESFRGWLLYSSWTTVIQQDGDTPLYLSRDGTLRAMGTSGHAIALGYLMVVGIGLCLFLQRFIQQKIILRLGMGLLVVGSIAALSRGPWVGAAVLLVIFIATGQNPARRLIGLVLAAIIAFFLITLLPGGERVINLLPFIGSTEKGNITYRENLITNSMIVIQRNLWFGSADFFKAPEMEAMRQGQGIIDLVNSYIQVALEAGLVGLGLFVAFFALTLLGIYRAMRSIPDKDSEDYLLGRALLATQVAILVIIMTASSILVIPITYWSVAALGMAYVQMVRKNAA